MLKRLMRLEVGVVAGGQLLQQVLTVFTGVVIARFLGSAAYGIVNLLRNITQLITLLAPLGLDLALLKHVGRAQEGGGGRLRAVLLRLRLVTVAVNLVVLAAGVAAGPWLEAHVYRFPGFSGLLVVALAAAPLSADLAVMGAYYRGRGRPGTFALLTLYLQPVVRVVLVLAAWVWLRSALAVVAINTLQVAVSAAAMWAHSARWRAADARAGAETPPPLLAEPVDLMPVEAATPSPPPPAAWRESRAILAESLWMAANLFVYGLMRFADTLTLGAYAPARVVGAYAALSTVAQLIQVWPMAASQTLGPRVSRAYHEGDMAGVHAALSGYIRMAMLVAGFVFGGVAAFGDRLDLVFGPSFTFDAPLCIVLALGYLVSAALSPMGYSLSMTGRHRAELVILTIGGAALVVLCQVLAPRYQAMGVAVAVVCAFGLIDVTRYVYVARVLRFLPGRLRDAAAPVVALACAFAAKTVVEWAGGRGLATLLVGCAVYGGAYAALVWTGFLRADERRGLLARLQRRSA